MRKALSDHVDQLKRKEQFLAAQPDVWMFMRKLSDWQAKQADGSELRAGEPRPLSRR